MNARLQRLSLLIRSLLGAGGLALGWQLGGWPWALALAVLAVNLRNIVLLLLFISLAFINRQHLPGVGDLLRAWWLELWALERTFSWRQPFAEHRHADYLPPSASARGVLLLHGFNCNRGLWNGWMQRLRALDVPHMALSMEPAFGSIDAYVDEIEQAVVKLQATTGQAPLVLAHSMGGLAARAWWRRHGRDARIHGLVTLGSPHAGTVMARFSPARNAMQMRRHSRWLDELVRASPAAPPTHCYFSDCDQIVCPAETATLPQARNLHLPGRGHLSLVEDPQVTAEVMALLRA
ncbi:alpha/beta fold hydrolase [Pelomonas sp. SE-A7]|uniref:esterase/lipase family protein n=1 Tax=Pelomonas sp. SE-A7 TaxID=3054953 RepID=UPI00259CC205|nr:alpha/beta fold hydrolase [Pelomonas sp. SE-A7]MDM4767963.1 alpha/beta fold hydrolase [Pelomonas sp. SE-A7]